MNYFMLRSMLLLFTLLMGSVTIANAQQELTFVRVLDSEPRYSIAHSSRPEFLCHLETFSTYYGYRTFEVCETVYRHRERYVIDGYTIHYVDNGVHHSVISNRYYQPGSLVSLRELFFG